LPTSFYVLDNVNTTPKGEGIVRAVRKMAAELTERLGDDEFAFEWSITQVEIPARDTLLPIEATEVNLYAFDIEGDEIINFTVDFYNLKEKAPELQASFLAINPKMQNQGLSRIFLRGSVDALQNIGGKKVVVDAALDRGGYAWLRAGFFPDEEFYHKKLRRIVFESKHLTTEQKGAFLGKNADELREFVLSDEFRNYKKAFSGQSWVGSADITDQRTLQAMLGEYVTNAGAKLATTTANRELSDAYLRHQIHLLRGAKGEAKRINALLDQSQEEISGILRAYDNSGGSGGIISPAFHRRLENLQAEIAAIRSKAFKESMGELDEAMVVLAKSEPVTIDNINRTVSPVVINNKIPTTQTLQSIVKSRPFQGKVLKEWAETMESADLARIRNQVQLGMVNGESMQTITRRVFGTLQAEGTDGVVNITRNQINAITRTAVQHVANQARREFALLNADIAPRERYTATLDSRTTLVCMSLDGNIYKVGVGPYPPIHFQCRSIRRQIFSDEVLGHRPAKQVTDQMLVRQYTRENDLKITGSRKLLPKGHKGKFDAWARKRTRQLIGPVPAVTNYEIFLRSQSREFVEDTLGKTKSKLFINGNLPLKRFVHRTGDELTLAEIATRDSDAFLSAGLDPADFL